MDFNKFSNNLKQKVLEFPEELQKFGALPVENNAPSELNLSGALEMLPVQQRRNNTGFPSAYPVPESTPFADFGRGILDAFTYTPDPNTTYMERAGKNLAGDMNSMITGFDAQGNKVPDSLRMMSLMMPGGTGLGGKAGLGILGAATGAAPKVGSAYASRLIPTLENMPQDKMSAEQFSGWLSKQPVGADELEYSGILGLLDEGGDVTKTGLLDQARANPLDIQDVVLGDHTGVGRGMRTKFSDYQLPGGEDYKEMLLTLPPAAPARHGYAKWLTSTGKDPDAISGLPDYVQKKLIAEYETYKGAPITPSELNDANVYKSGHFDQPNVLAHARYNTRTIDGDKTLFIEEIQSDWHQKGRDVGYKDSPQFVGKLSAKQMDMGMGTIGWEIRDEKGTFVTNVLSTDGFLNAREALTEAQKRIDSELPRTTPRDDRVPDAPYKRTDKWAGLTLQRMVKEAVDSGHDRIAWTPGKVQAERYDLSKQIDGVEVFPEGSGTYAIMVKEKDAYEYQTLKTGVTDAELADHIGKELAEKAQKQIGDNSTDFGALSREFDQLNKRQRNRVTADDWTDADDARLSEVEDILNEPFDAAHFEGTDLQVGGEGMKEFYDKMLVKSANKFGKKYGAKVEVKKLKRYQRTQGEAIDTGIPQSEMTDENLLDELGYTGPLEEVLQEVWTMKITPEMKAGISKGVMLGQTGAEGKVAAGLLSQDDDEQMPSDLPMRDLLGGTLYTATTPDGFI